MEQRKEYARQVYNYSPQNHNSKIKSALITAGRGALQGFARGGLGGAIFGGAGGAIQGAVDPSTDEKFARSRALSQTQGEIDSDLKRRKLDQEFEDAISQRALQGAQTENLRSLPGRERDRHWESLRKDLVSTYNDLAEYDPETSPQLAKALLSFGIDAPPKTRAKHTQIVIDQKTGDVRVVSADQTSGAATAAPVMEGEKPLVTTTGPMMSAEQQGRSQTFQREQQGRSQTFQRGQQERRETYGQGVFNQKREQQLQEKQKTLVGGIDRVIASLGRMNSQIEQLKSKGMPEPNSPEEKQLIGLVKNRDLVLMQGDKYAAELNALGGDYEAGSGQGGYPYYKARPGRATQSPTAGAAKYSEADVRARARSAGKDENMAVQKARAAGLIP